MSWWASTAAAQPQVAIVSSLSFSYSVPFILLQLNLNKADQVLSQRASEVDKGGSRWLTALSPRAWQKKW